jgi:hypothetical protein
VLTIGREGGKREQEPLQLSQVAFCIHNHLQPGGQTKD